MVEILRDPFFVAILAAFIVFVGYMGLDVMVSRKQQLKKLKQFSLGADIKSDYDRIFVDAPAQSKSLQKLLSKSPLGGGGQDKYTKKYKDLCMYAGITSPSAPIYCIIAKIILMVVCVCAAAYIAYSVRNATGSVMFKKGMMAGMLLLIGFKGVDLFLKNKMTKRHKVLTHAMPDTLDLMVVCVESGLALDAALARVCKELGRAHPEITKELNQTRTELVLLNDRTQALTNLAERTNLMSFRSLVASLIQTEKFGTSLSDTLRVLSEDYRLTRLMQAEEKAGKLPVLMTLPLICLLMPSFVLVILGPAYVKLKQNGGLFGKDAPVID